MKEYCVYCLYKNNVIIYIGMTKNLPARLRAHNLDKDFDLCTVISDGLSKDEAVFGEQILIEFATKYLRQKLSNVQYNAQVKVSQAAIEAYFSEQYINNHD